MSEYIKVAVDAMGGDNAPKEIVKGAVEAVNENSKVKVYLVGIKETVEKELSGYTYPRDQTEVMTLLCLREVQAPRWWADRLLSVVSRVWRDLRWRH